jgi:DNA replication protein DnaC
LERVAEKAPEALEEPTPPSAAEVWLSRLERYGVASRFRNVPHTHEPIDWHGTPWSLVLYGEVGSGKTYQAVAVLGKVGEELSASGLFVDCAVAVEEMRQQIGREGPRLVERMMRVGVLLLDDFGGERLDTEFGRDAFSTVLRYRYNEEKPTIVTTNLLPESGKPSLKSLHPQLYSRFREGEIVRLKGHDRRAL